MEQSKELQEQPINFVFVPGAKIVLNPQEFEILTRPLRMFEMAISVANMKNDQLIDQKLLVPVYAKDVDEQGKIKNPKAFFAQFEQEEKPLLFTNSAGATN
jgi:hypothetical protein